MHFFTHIIMIFIYCIICISVNIVLGIRASMIAVDALNHQSHENCLANLHKSSDASREQCVHIYIHVYKHANIYIYANIELVTGMHDYIQVQQITSNRLVHIHLYDYVYVYVYIYIYICLCMYTYDENSTYAHACIVAN